MSGWTTEWLEKHQRKMAALKSGQTAPPPPETKPEPKPKLWNSQGVRSDLGIYFRSAWEANFARYLNWLVSKGEISGWTYEPTTFWFEAIKRGVRSYKPDFGITPTEGEPYFIELKGWMDPRSRTKLKRMAKYHPKVRVDLVDEAAYRAIARTVSSLIPGWE
jgi:hypothetical protein